MRLGLINVIKVFKNEVLWCVDFPLGSLPLSAVFPSFRLRLEEHDAFPTRLIQYLWWLTVFLHSYYILIHSPAVPNFPFHGSAVSTSLLTQCKTLSHSRVVFPFHPGITETSKHRGIGCPCCRIRGSQRVPGVPGGPREESRPPGR